METNSAMLWLKTTVFAKTLDLFNKIFDCFSSQNIKKVLSYNIVVFIMILLTMKYLSPIFQEASYQTMVIPFIMLFATVFTDTDINNIMNMLSQSSGSVIKALSVLLVLFLTQNAVRIYQALTGLRAFDFYKFTRSLWFIVLPTIYLFLVDKSLPYIYIELLKLAGIFTGVFATVDIAKIQEIGTFDVVTIITHIGLFWVAVWSFIWLFILSIGYFVIAVNSDKLIKTIIGFIYTNNNGKITITPV